MSGGGGGEVTPIHTERTRWTELYRRMDKQEQCSRETRELCRQTYELCRHVDNRSMSTHSDLEKRVGLLESKAMVVPLAVAVVALAAAMFAIVQSIQALTTADRSERIHRLAHPLEARIIPGR